MPLKKQLNIHVREQHFSHGPVKTGETKDSITVELNLKAPTEQVIKECLSTLTPSINEVWLRKIGIQEPMEQILTKPDKHLRHLYEAPLREVFQTYPP